MSWDWGGLIGKKERCQRCRRNPVSGRKLPWGYPKLCDDCAEEYDREREEEGDPPVPRQLLRCRTGSGRVTASLGAGWFFSALSMWLPDGNPPT